MNAIDRERSEAAVREYGAAVYRLAFSQLQNIADTEDVFQEVFLRYVEKAPVFQGQEHEKAWLLRVTLNCCRDLFRSPFRRRRTALEEAENLPAWDAEETHLREQLQKLPKKDRAVLHLFYWEDMTTEQMALALGCQPAAARQRLKRARTKLKKLLEEEENDYVGEHI